MDALSVLQLKRMQEAIMLKPRQILTEKQNSNQEIMKRSQMPFRLQRTPYKKIIVYDKKGHWSQKQKLKYAVFLEHFKERFEIQAKRRFNNIFDLMAIFIKTRNAHQCRSHHQKMEKQKFKIGPILAQTVSKYHPQVYQQLKQRYVNEIDALEIGEEQNFEKFKQRIEKIEMRKKAQKEVLEKNKRVLRSSRKLKTKKQKKFHKKTLQKKGDGLQKKTHFSPHRQVGIIKNEPILQKQQQKRTQRDFLVPKIQNNQQLRMSEQQYGENHRHRLKQDQSCRVGCENQLKFYNGVQILEKSKKEHLDLAYFHFSEYMRHINQANLLQFQLRSEVSMMGSSNNFVYNTLLHQINGGSQ